MIKILFAIMSCVAYLSKRNETIEKLKVDVQHPNATVDTYVIVGDNPGVWYKKEDGYLQFPVSDEYYAFVYKVNQVFAYAELHDYDVVVKIDDDMTVNKTALINEIVQKYNPSMYMCSHLWQHLRDLWGKTERVQDNGFSGRFGGKQIHLNYNQTLEHCGPHCSGHLYLLGRDHFHKLSDWRYVRHYLEDVGTRCQVGFNATLLESRRGAW